LPPSVRIKAAGGVRTLDALLEVRSLGVARAGATQTARMLRECQRRLGVPLEAEPAPEPVGKI
jgi:deoxyribose-phosphate aldolase